MFIVNPERLLPQFSNYPLGCFLCWLRCSSCTSLSLLSSAIVDANRLPGLKNERRERFFSFAGLWMFWLISKNPLRFLFLLKGSCLLFYSCKNLFTDEIDNFFAMFYGHSPGWIGLYSNDAKYAGFRVVWYASDGCNVGHTCFVSRSSTLIPTVVLKIDSAIHLMYPSTHLKSIRETSCLIHWIEKKIYTLDTTIHLLNNSGQIARPLLVMLVSISNGQYIRSSFQSSYLCTPSHHPYIP